MTSFQHFKATHELKKLAERAVDFSKPGALATERLEHFVAEGVGFRLLYGTQRIDLDVCRALFALAQEARVFEKMAAMQSGAVINRIEGFSSEERAALHTAMRDVFGSRQEASLAKRASEAAERELHKLEKFLAKTEGRFTDVVQIGIGGSDLGPRALCLALTPFHRPEHRAHFISNVDPDDVNGVLATLDLKKTLFVVVSKSGTTLETLTNEEFVRARLRKMGLNPKEHFVAVTGEKSPMDDPSRYLASFYIWDFVGGRYSATSMVGAVTLGFCLGINGVKEILKGAHEMDQHALEAAPEKNIPLLLALLGIWNRNFLGLPTLAIIPYSQALHRFPAHLQQLDMESNGKHVDKQGREVDFGTGPVIWGEPGTNGQHSFYQLIHQGTDPIPVEFIGFRQSQYPSDIEIQHTSSQEKLLSNLLAQSLALALGQSSDNPNRVFKGNRPNSILLGDRLDPHSLGALLALYEHKVAFQGFIWNINSFDQEGVQLGKKLAGEILGLFKAERMGEKKVHFPLGETYLNLLNRSR
ncbi:MAG TPA: glucose-6-phosphate isomerase [Chlamydiales bacterium]|jgi:glucose-6-phosphate isomerase